MARIRPGTHPSQGGQFSPVADTPARRSPAQRSRPARPPCDALVTTPPDYFVRQDFRQLVERVALPRMWFHDLRHTFATLQLNGKQPLKIVTMMGHTRVAITQDLYTHVSAQIQRGGAAALNAAPEPWR